MPQHHEIVVVAGLPGSGRGGEEMSGGRFKLDGDELTARSGGSALDASTLGAGLGGDGVAGPGDVDVHVIADGEDVGPIDAEHDAAAGGVAGEGGKIAS